MGEPGFFDPKYNGLSPEEHIRQHDRDKMLWKQQQELAKANELHQQQLQQEKENAQVKAQAEIESAQIKAQAIKQAEKDRFNNQLYLEAIRQANENTQRKLKLCDDLGVDYTEIQLFENYLTVPDESLSSKLKQLKENIEYKERALNDYNKNKPDKNKIIGEYDKKIKSIESSIIAAQNSYNYSSDDLGVAYLIVLNLGLISGVFGCGVAWFSSNQDLWKYWTIGLLIATIFIDIIYKLFKKMKQNILKNNKLKVLGEELEKAKIEKDSKLKEFKKDIQIKMQTYNNNITRVSNEIKEFKEEKEKVENEIKQVLLDRYNKFMEFRTTHYNEEMEMLLRKLEIEYLSIMDKEFIAMNGNIDEHIEKEGSVKDYIQYMRKALRN